MNKPNYSFGVKVRLFLLRWILDRFVKQGHLHLMRPFYRELYLAHEREFTEDSASALRGFVTRSFEEANGQCWNCSEDLEGSTLQFFEDAMLRKCCKKCAGGCVPKHHIIDR